MNAVRLFITLMMMTLNVFAEENANIISQHTTATAPLYNQKIYVGAIIKNDNKLLPDFFKTLEKLDYDKKLITLHFVLYNDSPELKELMQEWIQKNKSLYAQLVYVDNQISTSFTNYNPERFKLFGKVKNNFLKKTKKNNCDYCLIVESDIFIYPNTLKILLNKQKPIIAPLLTPIPNTNKLCRNFFYKATQKGYLIDCPEYYPIAFREKLGTFKVDCVNGVYLINKDSLDKLSFGNEEEWEYITFCRNANENKIDQYICNEENFGYFLSFDGALTQDEERSFSLYDTSADAYKTLNNALN